MRTAFLIFFSPVLIFFSITNADANDSLKVYDKGSLRGECPAGYTQKGRFAEFNRETGKPRGGVECLATKGHPQSKNLPHAKPQPQKPSFPLTDQPNQLTLEEKDGKDPKCPDGYVQTGSFSNAIFANGKLEKKSGIYCSKTNPTEQNRDAAPDSGEYF